MGILDAGRRWRPGPRAALLGLAVLAVSAALAAVVGTTLAWGDTLREEGRLLPGTTIDGLDVGGLTLDEATATVDAHLSARLERGIEAVYDDRRWETSTAELGGETDLDEVSAAAFARTEDAGVFELLRRRFRDADALAYHVEVRFDGAAVEALVDDIATELDRGAVDARVRWSDGELVLDEGRVGRQVDREAVVDTLAASLAGDGDEVELEVATLIPDVPTDAAEAVLASLQGAVGAALDRTVWVVAVGEAWELTPRELDATPAVDGLLATALGTDELGLTGVRAAHASGPAEADGAALTAADVELDIHEDAVEGFLDDVVETVERDASDAGLTRSAGRVEVAPGRTGRSLDLDLARSAIEDALRTGADEVELDVDRFNPEITNDDAEAVVGTVEDAVGSALDRGVTVTVPGEERTVTPRDLDATASIDGLLRLALDGSVRASDVGLTIPDSSLERFVGSLASEVDRDPQARGASAPPRSGRELDRSATLRDLRSALTGGSGRVEVTVETIEPPEPEPSDGDDADDEVEDGADVAPDVLVEGYDRVLVLDQADRRLYYQVGDEVIGAWPVAVGLGDSPTPTGTFTIGAKRFEPTWHNPSPDDWGADMPASVGPGDDNPLGPRALNWNRDGRDTLIRFHGTPDEDSIGQAASRGCVRMYNADVIELYDRVPTGTTILSRAS